MMRVNWNRNSVSANSMGSVAPTVNDLPAGRV